MKKLEVAFDEKDKERVIQAAKAKGLSASAYIRQLVLDALKKEGV
jgi:hypothetical protein